MEGDNLADGVGRDTPQAIFAAVFKNQLDRRNQACAALLNGAALTVSSRNFERPPNVPFAVFLNHRREFVVHRAIIVHSTISTLAQFG